MGLGFAFDNCVECRLGIDLFSFPLSFILPLQLPKFFVLQVLTTRNACAFLQNSATVGFSCVPPPWR